MTDKILESQLESHRQQGRKQGVRVKDDADIADYLEVIKAEDEERFFKFLTGLPLKLQAQTVIELPGPFQADLIGRMEANALAELVGALETDDATDFMQLVLKRDREKAEAAFEQLPDKLQQTIRRLLRYDEDEAGSLMQTELFTAKASETIQTSLRRLRELKAKGALAGTHEVFIVDDQRRLLRVVPFSELILVSARKHYHEILDDFQEPFSVTADSPVEEAVRAMERYDLQVLPVVDRYGHLLGRITHDDAVDIIRELDTEQMYALGRVSADEELHEGVVATGRRRALWLSINLVNAVLTSVVIGFFEHTLEAVVALAVLMPIVANMAGTASVQTLTVMVRQIALGELTAANALRTLTKEFNISTVNGIVFGVAMIGVSYVWFDSWLIAAAMGLSMLVSFVSAGVIGAGAPVVLKRVGIDPAVASSVVVITLVDVIAFFSFLAFATILVLE